MKLRGHGQVQIPAGLHRGLVVRQVFPTLSSEDTSVMVNALKFSIHWGADCPTYICTHVKGYCLQNFLFHYQAVQLCPYYDMQHNLNFKSCRSYTPARTGKRCLQCFVLRLINIPYILLGDSATPESKRAHPWVVGFTLALIIRRQCRDHVVSMFLMDLYRLKCWTF